MTDDRVPAGVLQEFGDVPGGPVQLFRHGVLGRRHRLRMALLCAACVVAGAPSW